MPYSNSSDSKENTLYTTQAEEFSKTRTAPWSGWLELVKKGFIKPNNSYSILDLGCGNGRFLKFVKESAKVENYLGVDYSTLLLSQAKLAGGKVLKLDLDNTSWQIPKPEIENDFNFIAAFGIQHHLSSFEIRKYFLQQIAQNLSTDGLAIITYWQFLDYDRYKNKITPLKTENDYQMSFGSNQNARFCHYTSQAEIEKLEENSGLELIETFKADGRDNTENIYRIYKKA